MLAAIYTRFSTDRQRDTSIDDQVRNCERRAQVEGWTIAHRYADRALSGSRSDRPDYTALLADALAGKWQALIVDDLSRLSRDQVDAERTIRRLEHAGIIIVGASDGYDSRSKSRKVHRGVRNLLNEVYLDDLREKTHRGLEGQARRGNNAGGRCYGYRHVPVEDAARLDHLGRPVVVAVRREIDEAQAEHIRWIFERFTAGKSPAWIAAELNRREVPAPRGGKWAASSLYGSAHSETGILRNPLYAGRFLWNRSEWVKNPDTGKRSRRNRSDDERVAVEMPELRIVPQALWDAAQRRLSANQARGEAIRQALHTKARSGGPLRHLFSGLLKCQCGGPFVMVGNGRYGCSWAKTRGAAVCAVTRSVPRAVVESRLLEGIKRDLLSKDALELFVRETRRLLAEEAAKAKPDAERLRRELAEMETKIGRLVDAIAAGTFSPALQAALETAEAKKRELAETIEAAETVTTATLPDFLPRAADIYAELVGRLEDVLNEDADEARECLRGIVGDEILIRPSECGQYLEAEIRAGYLEQVAGLTLNVVAGAGFCQQSTIVALK